MASFLGVEAGLFYFDASYRPVPLEMQFVGVSERNILQAKNIMDDIAYDKARCLFDIRSRDVFLISSIIQQRLTIHSIAHAHPRRIHRHCYAHLDRNFHIS